MPRISAFYGIVITMKYRDHPPPHFHAAHAEHQATIDTASLRVIEGALPTRALRLVRKWARLHQAELQANWERARTHEPLTMIEPLP